MASGTRAGAKYSRPAGGVPGVVVVSPSGRDDLDRRQRSRAVPGVDDGHRHLGAGDSPLHQRDVAVGEAPDHRARQLAGVGDGGDPQGRATTSRLDHERQTDPPDERGQHLGRTELAEQAVRQRDRGRHQDPRAVDEVVRRRLVEGPAAGCGVGADVGDARHVEDVAHRAVLAGRAVQQRPDQVGTVRPQPPEQPGVEIALEHLAARLPQRVGDPPAGPQRHLALVRQPAGQDQHPRGVGHARSGAGDRTWESPSAAVQGVGAEGVEQLELGVDHAGEAPHALDDALRRRVAERQPQVAAAGVAVAALGVERGAGDVGDPGGDGARQHRLGVQALGETRPHVEATVRHRPGRAGQVRGERVDEGVAPLAVQLAVQLDLVAPVVAGQVAVDRHLRERGRAEDRRLGREHELVAHRVRGGRPADPQTGREGLGERAEVDHALVVHRAQRRQRLGVETQQAVGVVLQHQHAVTPGHLEHARPPLERERHARGVVEVGDGVQQLHGAAGGVQRGEGAVEGVRVEPVVVHRGVDDLGLVGAEDPERADVAGGLGDHDVARVAEHPGDQVERLLRAGGDHDVVGVRADALLGHHRADRLAQSGITLPGAVLQRGGAGAGDQVVHHLGHGVHRQRGEVGHPAGERDHLGPAGDGEQRPDLGRRHAAGAGGVAVGPPVQRGAADLVHRLLPSLVGARRP